MPIDKPASVLSQLNCEFEAMHSQMVEQRDKAQAFFADYANEVRKSSYGLAAKDFVVGMLRRAEECGLYVPPKKES